MITHLLTFAAAFFASSVEALEAAAVVVALGAVRGWRSPLLGSAAAIVILAAIVALFGAVITAVPEKPLQIVVGFMLLYLGFRWFSKSTLKLAGVWPKKHHDDEEDVRRRVRDKWTSVVVAFNITMLEGIEVVLIVIAVGGHGDLPLAAIGGGAAALTVALVTAFNHHHLVKLPDVWLKLTVGIVLCSLGTFWISSGIGFAWPVETITPLVLGGGFAGCAYCALQLVRRLSGPGSGAVAAVAHLSGVRQFAGGVVIVGAAWLIARQGLLTTGGGYVLAVALALYLIGTVTAKGMKLRSDASVGV